MLKWVYWEQASTDLWVSSWYQDEINGQVVKKYASASLVQLGEADSAASRDIIYFR